MMLIPILTIVFYFIGKFLYQRWPMVWFIPVFFSIFCTGLVLEWSQYSYVKYFSNSEWLTFWLGPAVVALGTLLYKYLDSIQKALWPFLISVIAGTGTGLLMVMILGQLLDLPQSILATMLPLGITTPIAIEVTDYLGGDPSITSVLVIAVGLLGNMFGPMVLKKVGTFEFPALGVSLGTASHGIGTARAIEMDESAGIYSGLAMVFNAIFTVILAPVVWSLFY